MKSADYEFFYNTIVSMADYLTKTCKVFGEVIDNIEDIDNIIKRIDLFEDDADQAYHDFRYYVGRSKLSEDSEALNYISIVADIEKTIDDIDELANDFFRYDIKFVRDNAVTSILNLERASSELNEAIYMVRKNENPNSIFKTVLELDHYKVEAKKFFNINMNKLFINETNPVEIIKWKSIYESLLNVYEDYESIAEAFGKMLFNW